MEGMREIGYVVGLYDGKKLVYVEVYRKGFDVVFDSLYLINFCRG